MNSEIAAGTLSAEDAESEMAFVQKHLGAAYLE